MKSKILLYHIVYLVALDANRDWSQMTFPIKQQGNYIRVWFFLNLTWTFWNISKSRPQHSTNINILIALFKTKIKLFLLFYLLLFLCCFWRLWALSCRIRIGNRRPLSLPSPFEVFYFVCIICPFELLYCLNYCICLFEVFFFILWFFGIVLLSLRFSSHLVLTKWHIAIANSVDLSVCRFRFCYFRHFQVSLDDKIWQAYQGPDQIKLEIVVFPI